MSRFSIAQISGHQMILDVDGFEGRIRYGIPDWMDVNPSAGDLAAEETATLRGTLALLEGSAEDALGKIGTAQGFPVPAKR